LSEQWHEERQWGKQTILFSPTANLLQFLLDTAGRDAGRVYAATVSDVSHSAGTVCRAAHAVEKRHLAVQGRSRRTRTAAWLVFQRLGHKLTFQFFSLLQGVPTLKPFSPKEFLTSVQEAMPMLKATRGGDWLGLYGELGQPRGCLGGAKTPALCAGADRPSSSIHKPQPTLLRAAISEPG
jgi:hypothetical protein